MSICSILSKGEAFDLYQEKSGAPALLQLPAEVLSNIGRWIAREPNGIKDASSWSSVCVFTHAHWHKDLEDCEALKLVWQKMPAFCCFKLYFDTGVCGDSWGGCRPSSVMQMRVWFDDMSYDHQRAQIEQLYLAHLNLRRLPPEMAKLTNLTYINLSHNHLTSIPKVLGACSKLTQIILNNNQITEIPGWLKEKCPKLSWVELLNNPVSNLPEELQDIVILE